MCIKWIFIENQTLDIKNEKEILAVLKSSLYNLKYKLYLAASSGKIVNFWFGTLTLIKQNLFWIRVLSKEIITLYT